MPLSLMAPASTAARKRCRQRNEVVSATPQPHWEEQDRPDIAEQRTAWRVNRRTNVTLGRRAILPLDEARTSGCPSAPGP